jgi:hypothetical protein
MSGNMDGERVWVRVVGEVLGSLGMSPKELLAELVAGESAANAGMRARLHLSLAEEPSEKRGAVRGKKIGRRKRTR